MTRDSQKSLPFTLAFRVPLSFRKFISACNRKLSEVCRSFEPIETAHITVKFLGHSCDHLNEDTIVDYLPRIHEIAREFVPLKVFVRGFSTFQYETGRKSVIYLRIMPNSRLEDFHHKVCDYFSDVFETFPHADQHNFEPHLTLSKDLYQHKNQLIERIIARSHKMAKRMLKLDDLVVMSANRLYPVQAEVSLPIICPPVK